LFNTPAGITQNYLYEKFIIMKQHDYQDLIKLFNHLFEFTENTILIAHGTEPLYLPQDENSSKNRIIFTHDYYSSALHEIAHWCIASKERRKLNDYGYWYNPHRTTIEDQHLFEYAEAKPQALEWIFSVAAGIKFNISADNLALNNEISLTFKNLIYQQVIKYLTEGLPDRAELFKKSLLSFYNCDDIFDLSLFSLN
jgi:elongation factor P hydroxylase